MLLQLRPDLPLGILHIALHRLHIRLHALLPNDLLALQPQKQIARFLEGFVAFLEPSRGNSINFIIWDDFDWA